MVLALAFYAMAALPGAACGHVFAYTKDEDPTLHLVLGALLPPAACFYALTLLLKKD